MHQDNEPGKPEPAARSRARSRVAAGAAVVVVAAVLAALLLRQPAPERAAPDGSPSGRGLFRDVSAAAGIDFRHEAGARGAKLNPETFGPGAAWFDADGDGRIDLLLVNGNALIGPLDPAVTSKLYRNLGGGRFEDVTAASGLAVPIYGMGAVTADVDNDADQDVFLYGVHRSLFFLNDGDGVFREATTASGLAGVRGWVGAATFLDYDRDGRLDLYVGNYVRWSPALEDGLDCTYGGAEKLYCPVAVFAPAPPQLFRGDGAGSFADVTAAAGLAELEGKTLGVVVEDHDRNGYPDLLVANDSVANFLLHNRGDGTFIDDGVASGFATDANGAPLAGMGIDTAWLPDGGPLWVAIGNFSGEPTTVHRSHPDGSFTEQSFPLGVGLATLKEVTFGLLLHDHDLDGDVDLLAANGHVFDAEPIMRVPYRQKLQFFRGHDWERFEPVGAGEGGELLSRAYLGRALAAADHDDDGDLDLLLTENQGPAHLLRNELTEPRRFVRLRLTGTESARDAIGAEVTLITRRARVERRRRQTRRSASSYLAQCDPRILFGLGVNEEPVAVEIRWPLGRRQRLEDVPLNVDLTVTEPTGPGSEGPGPATLAQREAREAGDASALAERRRAVELLARQSLGPAIAALERALALDPYDFVAHRLYLVALRRAGRRADVESHLQVIVERFPSANLIASRFAGVLRAQDEHVLAELCYLEAARLEPERPDFFLALGDLAYDRGELETALARYRKTVSLQPRSAAALANIGKIHTLQKEWTPARAALEAALAARPGYATALSTLGGVLIAEGELAAAERTLLDALAKVSSGDTETLLSIRGNLGVLYLRARRLSEAREQFERVLEIDPTDQQARTILDRLRAGG